MFSSFYNWMKGLFGKAKEMTPVIKEGQDIVLGLTEIINDLQGKRYGEVVLDVRQLVVDVTEFAAEVEKFVNAAKAVKK